MVSSAILTVENDSTHVVVTHRVYVMEVMSYPEFRMKKQVFSWLIKRLPLKSSNFCGISLLCGMTNTKCSYLAPLKINESKWSGWCSNWWCLPYILQRQRCALHVIQKQGKLIQTKRKKTNWTATVIGTQHVLNNKNKAYQLIEYFLGILTKCAAKRQSNLQSHSHKLRYGKLSAKLQQRGICLQPTKEHASFRWRPRSQNINWFLRIFTSCKYGTHSYARWIFAGRGKNRRSFPDGACIVALTG